MVNWWEKVVRDTMKWEEVKDEIRWETPLPSRNTLKEAADILRDLARELPALRRAGAVASLYKEYDPSFTKEKEAAFLATVMKAAQEEAAYFLELAQKLARKEPGTKIEPMPTSDPFRLELEFEVNGENVFVDCDLKNDPQMVREVLGMPVAGFSTAQGTFTSTGSLDLGRDFVVLEITSDECPQGHHKLDGDCRYDYCRCSCQRCKAQCEKHGR